MVSRQGSGASMGFTKRAETNCYIILPGKNKVKGKGFFNLFFPTAVLWFRNISSIYEVLNKYKLREKIHVHRSSTF